MKSDKWLTISNVLTVLRILLAPVIVMGIVYREWEVVFLLIIIAGLTDVLDGYFARWLSQRTVLGASLDPIADKILLVSCFAALSCIASPSFFIPRWFLFLVLLREALILGGSLILFLLKIDFKVSPSIFGKLTTFFQLSFILWLFICYFFGWSPLKTDTILLVLLALFSLASLTHYGVIGIRYLKNTLK